MRISRTLQLYRVFGDVLQALRKDVRKDYKDLFLRFGRKWGISSAEINEFMQFTMSELVWKATNAQIQSPPDGKEGEFRG